MFRYYSCYLYEGGIRVPAFANWPGQLKPGAVDLPTHISDWLPTLCRLTGSRRNLQQMNLDGQDIWPLLTGESTGGEKRKLYWKTSSAYATREGQWKLLIHRNSEKAELYDLENDFRETRDLSDVNPGITAHLVELMEEFKKGDREKK